MIREAPHVRPRPMVLGGKRTKSRDGSSSSRSAGRLIKKTEYCMLQSEAESL